MICHILRPFYTRSSPIFGTYNQTLNVTYVPNFNGHTRTHTDTRGHTRTHTDTRGHTDTHTGTHTDTDSTTLHAKFGGSRSNITHYMDDLPNFTAIYAIFTPKLRPIVPNFWYAQPDAKWYLRTKFQRSSVKTLTCELACANRFIFFQIKS
jgi:hypothetical protein